MSGVFPVCRMIFVRISVRDSWIKKYFLCLILRLKYGLEVYERIDALLALTSKELTTFKQHLPLTRMLQQLVPMSHDQLHYSYRARNDGKNVCTFFS